MFDRAHFVFVTFRISVTCPPLVSQYHNMTRRSSPVDGECGAQQQQQQQQQRHIHTYLAAPRLTIAIGLDGDGDGHGVGVGDGDGETHGVSSFVTSFLAGSPKTRKWTRVTDNSPSCLWQVSKLTDEQNATKLQMAILMASGSFEETETQMTKQGVFWLEEEEK
ncbi:hypothetical protein ACLKA7_013941 [Drosophila subpalustris]